MIDWAAKWFEIRAEMGQSDMATMMYQDKDKVFKKVHFPHREADGFGKILSVLQQEGIKIKAPIRPLKKPSSLLHFYLLLKGLLIHPRLPNNPWKNFSSEAQSGGPDEVSYWFLTSSENEKLKSLAKSNHLNLSFFIVSEIDQIIKRRLYKNPQDPGVWLSPVDLRGAFPNAKAGQNFVSFIPTVLVGINNSEAVKNSYEKYKSDLKAGVYWAFWELAHIGKWIGLGGMRWLIKQGANRSFWMGSFSDLGVWNQEALLSSSAKDRYWVLAPPGSQAYPVGITTIEWCGNRSITIKVHPAICNQKSVIASEEIITEFKEKILKS